LEQALRAVKDVFGGEYAAAKSNVQKQALANKMLETAEETRDPVERYAVLQVARQIATEAGDGAGAFRTVDQMAKTFRIDVVRMKAAVLYELSQKARTAAQHKSVADQSFRLADEAVRGDDMRTAIRLADTALAESRKARDSQLGKQIVVWRRDFDQVVQAYELAKQGLDKLKADPTDATANRDVGRYACFVKGDWQNGLMMLALGNDPQLKQIAVREIEPPPDAAQRAEIGHAWWELAEKTEGLGKTAMYARAAYHYRLAARHTSGLLAVKIKKRLAQLAEDNAEALRDAEQMARRPAPASPSASPPARRTQPPVAATDQPPPVSPPGEVPAAPADTPPVMPPDTVPTVSRVVTIPANSAKGYVIGPVARGTKITLQYVSGSWKAWGSRGDICPDKTGGRGGSTCLLAIVAFDSEGKTPQLLTVVSQGTRTTPFSYQVPQDVPLLVLRIKGKGNKWSGNPGRVRYNLTVSPP
jgi:hypothetical protein